MDNTFQLNKFNDVDLGDDSLTIDPTPGSGVSASTECTLDGHVNLVSPVVVESRDDAGARDGDGAEAEGGAGVEGGSAAFQRKERQKISKVWNDFSSITINGVKKFQCNWCKRLLSVGKSSTTSTLSRYLTACVKFVEVNSLKKQKTLSFEPSDDNDGLGTLTNLLSMRRMLENLLPICANAVAIDILRDDIELRGSLPIGGLMFHVRCCAHIINLLVQAGLTEIGDIIDSVRQGIKYIVASERRLNLFSDIAKRLDLGCNKLILDVPTRWNNANLMLKTAIRFKEVFPRYYRVEQAFLWVVSPEQWDKVENVNQVLAVFNDVINVVSGSDYPTSNLFLPEVWRMKRNCGY
ncbi:zinc finger BED domain-containing protein RICESLEEPER 2-like [Corylus avellana]|uniref:zinc finger BED domain-containing protein RICESLEEPER 2-like n=1 Tax=Corylus avellana TaxID=13451 RepID=UPI00286AFAE0|nr:zinc finger BED domain-containing protein RICESLEEPER 2-like [Corylus avellana]